MIRMTRTNEQILEIIRDSHSLGSQANVITGEAVCETRERGIEYATIAAETVISITRARQYRMVVQFYGKVEQAQEWVNNSMAGVILSEAPHLTYTHLRIGTTLATPEEAIEALRQAAAGKGGSPMTCEEFALHVTQSDESEDGDAIWRMRQEAPRLQRMAKRITRFVNTLWGGVLVDEDDRVTQVTLHLDAATSALDKAIDAIGAIEDEDDE